MKLLGIILLCIGISGQTLMVVRYLDDRKWLCFFAITIFACSAYIGARLLL